MTIHTSRPVRRAVTAGIAWMFLLQVTAGSAGAYALGSAVGDMRQAATRSGGTACPQLTRFGVSTPGTISRQWSTALGTNPVTNILGRIEFDLPQSERYGIYRGRPGLYARSIRRYHRRTDLSRRPSFNLRRPDSGRRCAGASRRRYDDLCDSRCSPGKSERLRPRIDPHTRTGAFLRLQSLRRMEGDDVSLRASAGAIHRRPPGSAVARRGAIRR